MSVKIWEAYRLVDPSQLQDVLHDIRIKGRANVTAKLREVYKQMMLTANKESELWKKHEHPQSSEEGVRLSYARELIYTAYRDQVTSFRRDTFDFDVWVAVRSFDGVTCLIPRADSMMRGVLNFMKEDPRLADFHYQNQVDRVKGITEKDWAFREGWYNRIDSEDRWNDVTFLQICSWDFFGECDPWFDLAREMHARKKSESATV